MAWRQALIVLDNTTIIIRLECVARIKELHNALIKNKSVLKRGNNFSFLEPQEFAKKISYKEFLADSKRFFNIDVPSYDSIYFLRGPEADTVDGYVTFYLKSIMINSGKQVFICQGQSVK